MEIFHADTIGFSHAGVPKADPTLLTLIIPELPAIAIILIIEHIAISKSFGRINSYTITPSQEIVALGAANLFSPFAGGYCCTGSFGASAVLSKAGVRTPLAGLFSALVLVLALYALTAVFYYIPMAALAGLIIHAVSNLIAPPAALYRYWQLSPFELLIWIVGVVLAIFESLDVSIYATIALSAVLLLVRMSRSPGKFMGVVKTWQTGNAESDLDGEKMHQTSDAAPDVSTPHDGSKETQVDTSDTSPRDVFMPLDRSDGSNKDIRVETPYPGVFIYRYTDGLNYTNQAHHVDLLSTHITTSTRPTQTTDNVPKADRLWCDPGPKELLPSTSTSSTPLPLLRAVVLDFSTVNNIDITSVQGLIDLRNELDKRAAPEAVDWHFAGVRNRWTRRALAVAGFGFPLARNGEWVGTWRPVYCLAGLREGVAEGRGEGTPDEENKAVGGGRGRAGVVGPVDRPFFSCGFGGCGCGCGGGFEGEGSGGWGGVRAGVVWFGRWRFWGRVMIDL